MAIGTQPKASNSKTTESANKSEDDSSDQDSSQDQVEKELQMFREFKNMEVHELMQRPARR